MPKGPTGKQLIVKQGDRFIIDNSYEVEKVIGRGRGSVVYRAKCLPSAPVAMSQQTVAIKLLYGLEPEHAVRRLNREAKALLACRSDNVIKLIDYLAEPELCYLVMEYAQKLDLSSALSKKERAPDISEALRFSEQLLSGLAAVHKARVVHRDVKFENILIDSEWNLKLSDFGIAYLPQEVAQGFSGNRGEGTFDYLAPETLEFGTYDFRSDLFAAALTIYELIVGELPFGGDIFTEQISNKISGKRKPLPSYIRQNYPELVIVFDKALSADPQARYQTAEEFGQAVSRVISPKRESFIENDSWSSLEGRSYLNTIAVFFETLRDYLNRLSDPRVWHRNLLKYAVAAATSAVVLFIGARYVLDSSVATAALQKLSSVAKQSSVDEQMSENQRTVMLLEANMLVSEVAELSNALLPKEHQTTARGKVIDSSLDQMSDKQLTEFIRTLYRRKAILEKLIVAESSSQ